MRVFIPAFLSCVLLSLALPAAAQNPPPRKSVNGAKAKSIHPIDPVGKRIVFKGVAGQQLAIFISSPPPAAGPGPHPALLLIHGGGWSGGSLNEFDRQAAYLAGRGIVAIQVQYRLIDNPVNDSIDPCVMDAKSAMRYVRAHAAELGVDPKRIGASGSSAGAQLAGFLGMMDGKDDPTDNLKISARANLMVLLSAAIDVSPGPNGCCHHHGTPDYLNLSPALHVRPGLPPTLVMQGDADEAVSPAMVEEFAANMKQAGNDITLTLYPGGAHGFFHNGANFYATLEETDKFLTAHGWLKGSPDEAALHALPAHEGPATRDAKASASGVTE